MDYLSITVCASVGGKWEVNMRSVSGTSHDQNPKDLVLFTYKILKEFLIDLWKFENKIIFLIIIIFRVLFIITLPFLNQTQQMKH